MLIDSNELLQISNEFTWTIIRTRQEEQISASNNFLTSEVAIRDFSGYYQDKGRYLTIKHILEKYEQPIDLDQMEPLAFGVTQDEVVSEYIPEIETSAYYLSKCIVLRQTLNICKVNIAYKNVKSNIYLSIDKYVDEVLVTHWLNDIIKAIESKILSEELHE